jgi:hypothetical protein
MVKPSQPRSTKKARKGTAEHARPRDQKTLRELLTIAAKLGHGEPLDYGESVLAGNLLRMVGHNIDPRPLFHERVRNAPKKAGAFWLALHYRLVREFDPDGSRLEHKKTPLDVALEVAESWGYEDPGSILRIARKHQSECDDILADAENDYSRRSLLLDMQCHAEEAKNQGKK